MSFNNRNVSKVTKDLRRYPRHRTFRTGRIILSDMGKELDVTISELSPVGAKFRLTEATILPKTFEIIILSAHVNDSKTLRANLKWHKGSYAAVEFLKDLQN